MKHLRPIFERTLQKTLDEVGREQEAEGSPAIRFKLTVEVELANGNVVRCAPVAIVLPQG